jgi:hypothetical protein
MFGTKDPTVKRIRGKSSRRLDIEAVPFPGTMTNQIALKMDPNKMILFVLVRIFISMKEEELCIILFYRSDLHGEKGISQND